MPLDTQSPFGTHARHWFKRLIWTICDAPAFSAPTRQSLRKKFARKLKGPFDVTFGQINWRLYPEENYCDRVIFARKKLPEQAEHEALDDIIEPGIIFVDVGGNIGSYSLYVAEKSANTARILALEPHPRTFQKLQFNLQINKVKTATALQLASGPKRTTMQLWSDGGSNIGHTSVLKEGTSNPKISVDVDVVPLVEILAAQNIDKIDLLKIDIEGFEDQVLMPFFHTADKPLWPRHLLIETAHHAIWQDDVADWMKKAGYQVVFQTKENLLLKLSYPVGM
jgi:FkbM family methyltransferase